MEPTMKLKRKELDLEGVNDDFSDFSLSSPARKIRRLDGEEMMMMKEDDEPMVFGEEEVPPMEKPTAVPDDVNEERAIVLFNPNPMAPLLQSPPSPSFSILVNSGDLVFGSKSGPVIWSGNRSDLLQTLLLNGETGKKQQEEEEQREKQGMPSNGCMAVVPWVPNPNNSHNPQLLETTTDDMYMMDDETAAMDIEEDFNTTTGLSPTFTTTPDVGIQGITHQGLNQWQQQHCMIPQLPQNLQTPISFFGNTDNN